VIAETAVRFNPFPGLRSFEPEEEHLFFGRERQIDDLLARLRRTRFLAVVGTSGSGKSSLVRSGLIPALHGGFMTKAGSSWRVAIFRPGDDPVGNLAAALATPEVLGCDPEIADLHRTLIDTTLHRSARGLSEAVRLARIPEGDNVLLLVDQFEELFRFKRNPRIKDSHEEAVAFVRLLLEAAHQEETPIYVVLTMRSDFIGNCTELPGLAETVNDGQFLVPRMTREERRAAITGPVGVGGAAIAPRLVSRLLNDVGDDPDQLPILQHALMRTWERWESDHTADEPLDLRHFEAAGTLREALSLHAEEAWGGLSTGRERAIAAVLFKAVTERGPDNRGVRRPIRLAEVAELAGAGLAETVAVVDRFRLPGRSFLMPPFGVRLEADTVLDIAHESLMRIWDRLVSWVDEEGRSAELYLKLSKAALQYQEGSGGLWRDPELQLALNWREETRPTAAWAERYDPAYERAMLFLEYSKKERDLAIERRERERRSQLRRARWLAVVLGSAALVILVFGLYALTLQIRAEAALKTAQVKTEEARREKENAEHQKENAERQKETAELRKREAEEERGKADRSRLLAEEQKLRADGERQRAEDEQRAALVQKKRAEDALSEAERAKRDTEKQRIVAVKEKERAEALQVKAETSEEETSRLAGLQTARALALQSSRLQQPDQRQLAGLLAVTAYRLHGRSGGPAEDAAQYSALHQALVQLDPAREMVLRQHKDAVRALAVTPDGGTLVTGGDDGAVLRFDLRQPAAPPRPLATFPEAVRALAVDPAGRRLAAGTLDGTIRLWDLRADGSPRDLPRQSGAVNALAAAGSRLASASADGKVTLWDMERGTAAATLLDSHPHRLTAAAVSADGGTLAVGSAGGGVLLWDLGRPTDGHRSLGDGRDIRAVALSPDGRLLAAGTATGLILLWDLTGRPAAAPPAELTGHTAAVTSLTFGKQPGALASASLDGSVRLWNTAHREMEPVVLSDHKSWVWAVALSPDGGSVLSGGADRAVRVRWTRTAPHADALCARLTRNLTRGEWERFLPAGTPYEPTCSNLKTEGR
jgi:WD40 repeat protein/energy-coupling factor transporter ATP-binding protein EcfA2